MWKIQSSKRFSLCWVPLWGISDAASHVLCCLLCFLFRGFSLPCFPHHLWAGGALPSGLGTMRPFSLLLGAWRAPHLAGDQRAPGGLGLGRRLHGVQGAEGPQAEKAAVVVTLVWGGEVLKCLRRSLLRQALVPATQCHPLGAYRFSPRANRELNKGSEIPLQLLIIMVIIHYDCSLLSTVYRCFPYNRGPQNVTHMWPLQWQLQWQYQWPMIMTSKA